MYELKGLIIENFNSLNVYFFLMDVVKLGIFLVMALMVVVE